jgi:hypothetical protein
MTTRTAAQRMKCMKLSMANRFAFIQKFFSPIFSELQENFMQPGFFPNKSSAVLISVTL